MGVDPGVRTFATCYSEKEALVVGPDFAKNKVIPVNEASGQPYRVKTENPEHSQRRQV